MLEAAANANLVSTISPKRNTPFFQLSTSGPADYPIYALSSGYIAVSRQVNSWANKRRRPQPVAESVRKRAAVESPFLARRFPDQRSAPWRVVFKMRDMFRGHAGAGLL